MNKPGPFRADAVGSLLRPASVKAARENFALGKIDAGELAAIEDDAIAHLVRRQRDVGLTAVTDGEIRRAWWHYDFLENLDGAEGYSPQQGIQFAGVQTKAHGVRVHGRLGFSPRHPHLEHFRRLAALAPAGTVPKMTIPSPSMMHYRGGRAAVSATAYPDLAEYFADLGAAYRAAIAAFHAAGCRYLQLDDTSLAYLCDPAQRRMLSERGEDPDAVIDQYVATLKTALSGRPADMTLATHTCRGNFRSTFVASGGYAPLADRIFNEIDVDAYFMEWDDDRSGGFEPLRLLPKGKRVVLGLVTTKVGVLENPDAIKRRIAQAAAFVPLDQLCLSPQCGFSSTEEGNAIAEDEQWRKLELVVSIARDVWK